jgi:mannose-6-phosphate isomerase-like protein (cupin superfamily)
MARDARRYHWPNYWFYTAAVKVLHLDELAGVPVFGTLVWKPVRKTFGVTAFGINAYTAANAGDEVVEEHTEQQLGHEEIYAVISGRATFTVGGEEVDAPAGTLVYLDDVAQKRHAIAREPGTTVLAIGGVPGKHEISSWEYFFPALEPMRNGDYDAARTILEDGLAEKDTPVVH